MIQDEDDLLFVWVWVEFDCEGELILMLMFGQVISKRENDETWMQTWNEETKKINEMKLIGGNEISTLKSHP